MKFSEIALNTKFENKTKNFGKIFAEKKNNILIFRGITGLSHETYFFTLNHCLIISFIKTRFKVAHVVDIGSFDPPKRQRSVIFFQVAQVLLSYRCIRRFH